MKLSFAQKLWLPLGLSLTCLADLSLNNAYTTREIRLEERKADLAHATEIGLAVVKGYKGLVASHRLSKIEAKKSALEAIKNIRQGQSGYFTVFNATPTILMHPNKPEMIGKDVGSPRDQNGVFLYNESLALAKGGARGFTAYSCSQPGSSQAAALVDESAKAAHALHDKAGRLDQAVSVFRLA